MGLFFSTQYICLGMLAAMPIVSLLFLHILFEVILVISKLQGLIVRKPDGSLLHPCKTDRDDLLPCDHQVHGMLLPDSLWSGRAAAAVSPLF